ncbi:MAG: Asp-tRNA(Asn)/Glu-tRNA(Gln) amidotransferase subunit GatC [Nitrospinales bacterium]
MPEKTFDIDHIARLARLTLSESEKIKLEGHLLKIIEYIGQLDRVDTSNVEPTSHILPLQNVFREDEAGDEFSETDLLGQAPQKDKGHYEVPRIIN